MMDLLGSDLPVEGGTGGEFAWCDGIFLRALKAGDWVLLDELNLASQSVLEGLNSVLDHRAAVYIPELGRTFDCPSSFRIFACQNPVMQGGGRKGLPKSFLNRFTQVYVDELKHEDLLFITQAMYPRIPVTMLAQMITFNDRLYLDTMVLGLYGRKGSPWEFNLRDLSRWCSLMLKYQNERTWDPSRFVDLIYIQRMRSEVDRHRVVQLYNEVFGDAERKYLPDLHPVFHVTPHFFQVGHSWLPRGAVRSNADGETASSMELTTSEDDGSDVGGAGDDIHRLNSSSHKIPHLLQGWLPALESVMACIENGWMAILNGPTASGKTSLVRLLARLTGNMLREFSMNSSVDTTELLGGFEQIDLQRHKKEIIADVGRVLRKVSEHLLVAEHSATLKSIGNPLASMQDLHSTWALFNAKMKLAQQGSGSPLSDPSLQTSTGVHHLFDREQFNLLMQLIDKLEQLATTYKVVTSGRSPQQLRKALENLASIEKSSVAGCFEWMDGMLIHALESGDWILIDNVNFCNPTVLDRLNPLLEPNGVLVVNERGMVDGEVKVITPHPNFRIFLAMDPQNGEISRAMRNRGIEISLLPPTTVSHDTLVLLNGLGVPGAVLPEAMTRFHQILMEDSQPGGDQGFTLRDLLHWASLTVEQLQRGGNLETALLEAMELVYVRHLRSQTQQDHVRKLYHVHVAGLLSRFVAHSHPESPLVSAGLWPSFVSGESYCKNSVDATIARQSAVFRFYQLRHIAALLAAGEFEQLFPEKKTRGFVEKQGLVRAALEHPQLAEELRRIQCSLPLETLKQLLASASIASADGSETMTAQPILTVTESAELSSLAATYVLEMSSPEDWQHRFAWLNAIGGEIALQCSTLLQKIWSHPLTELSIATRKLIIDSVGTEYRQSIERTLAFQPLDIRGNPQLVARLWTAMCSNSEAGDQLWNFHLNLLDRMDILINFQRQTIIEDLAYLAPSTGKRGPSVIVQSKMLFEHKLRGGSVHPLVPFLYPFFKLLDDNITQHLLSPFPVLVSISQLREVIQQRTELWSLLNSLYLGVPVDSTDAFTSNIGKLHLCCRTLFRALVKKTSTEITSPASLSTSVTAQRRQTRVGYWTYPYDQETTMELSAELDSTISRVREMLSYSLSSRDGSRNPATAEPAGTGRIRDILWKRGGHPKLLHNADMFGIAEELRSLLRPFTQKSGKMGRGAWHPMMFSIDEEFKRMLVEGLVTLRWADSAIYERETNAGDDQDTRIEEIRGVTESLNELPKALQRRLQTFEETLAKARQEEEATEGALLEGERRFSREVRELQKQWAALWPLLDHLSMRQEALLLTKLMYLAATLRSPPQQANDDVTMPDEAVVTEARAEPDDGAAEGVMLWVKNFLTRGLGRTSRSPLDFLPYQQLLWQSQPNGSGTSNISKKDSEAQPRGSALPDRDDMMRLVQEMRFLHSSRLWHNTYNDLSLLRPAHLLSIESEIAEEPETNVRTCFMNFIRCI
jgi:MoxR-like ATPase